MSYKSISMVVTDPSVDETVLKEAAALAVEQDGHLHVLCVGVDPMRYDLAPLGAGPALSLVGSNEAGARARELQEWAEKVLSATTAAYAVQPLVVMSGGLEAAVARHVRYSDVVVATKPYGPDCTHLQTAVFEAVLFGTGVPILVMPQGGHLPRPANRVVIAWNESDEALEAVRKALPVLKTTGRASIIMIDPSEHSHERSDPGGAICEFLSRHGIKADVSVLAKTLPKVSDIVNRHILECGDDLLIMGAYGHSRFREAVLGGATRDMLETSQIPVLMAH